MTKNREIGKDAQQLNGECEKPTQNKLKTRNMEIRKRKRTSKALKDEAQANRNKESRPTNKTDNAKTRKQ